MTALGPSWDHARVDLSANPYWDDESAKRLLHSVAKVRGWAEVPRTLPEIPAGSPIAADDRVFPELPTSAIVWHSLASAVEHLTFGADIIEAEVRLLRPNAFHTLIRSALMGAAQALWIIRGEHAQRVVRSLLVVEDESRHQRTYLDSLRKDRRLMELAGEPGYAGMLADDVAALDERLAKVRAELRRRGRTKTFSSTETIKDAARYIAPDVPEVRRGLLEDWMRSSASAHSRMWAVNYRDAKPTLDGKAIRYTTSLSELTLLYGTPTAMLVLAFERWDELVRPALPPLVYLSAT